MQDLGGACAEEREIYRQEHGQQRACTPRTPFPPIARHEVKQDRRDGHGSGDRDAVRVGQIARAAKTDDQGHARDHQQSVDLGNEDLPLGFSRGVHDGHPRGEPQLHRLTSQRKRPRDQRLRGDDRRDSRQYNHGIEPDGGDQRVEWVLRLGLLEEQSPLPKVVDQQTGKHDGVPGHLDRAPAKMAHIGVQGFAPRDTQDDRAHDQEPVPAVAGEEAHGMDGIYREQDFGAAHDPRQPRRRDRYEPAQRQRTKDRANATRATFLHRE